MKRSLSSIPGRILMTADTIGGVWTYALELARYLGDYEIEVAAATMGDPLSPQQREEVGKIPNLRLFESTYKLEWMEDPWEDVCKAGDWLLQVEREFRPDVVHLNGYAHGGLPWKAPRLIVGHSCVVSWWKAVKHGSLPSAWDRYREEIARGLSSADMVIAPSRAMLKSLDENYGPLPSGRVIYNGRDASLFSPGWKGGRFVLTVGRLWDRAKNLSLVERAAAGIPWPIYAAGDKSFSGGEAPSDSIHLLGRLSQAALAGWYSLSPIFVLPAWYEPFGLSVLEAGLSGCALVLGDIPSLREIWGEAALYVSPEDPQDLESRMRELIEDEALREEFSSRSRRRALEFSPRRMALDYFGSYQELINRTRGGGRAQAEKGGRSAELSCES